jgi:hypothetical protein
MTWLDIVVIFGGIIGGGLTGFLTKKSSNVSDANSTIALKDSTISALQTEVAQMKNTIASQGVRIKLLEDDKASYIKLFQGNPSELEASLKKMADSQSNMMDTLNTLLALVQQKPATSPSLTINN